MRAKLEAGEFEELDDGRLRVDGHELSPDEVIVERRGKEGWAVAGEDGLTVALDLALDPELELEGRAREAIHQVNTMRKDAGLEITDRIALTLPPSSPRTRSGSRARRSPRESSRAASCRSRRPDRARAGDPGGQARPPVQEGPARGRRDRAGRPAGRDLRLPRSERRGQVDDRPHADDAAAADLRQRARRRLRRRQAGRAGADAHRRGAAGSRARPAPDRPRAPPPAGLAPGDPARRAGSSARTSCSAASACARPPTARCAATRAG